MLQENRSCTNCSHEKCFINHHCSEQWKQTIDQKKTTGVYQKKQAIFSEDNLAFGVYFIYKGKVKIFNSGKNGKQHIIRFAGPGDVLGFKGHSDKNYRVSSTALEYTEVCFLEKNTFSDTIKEIPEFAVALIQ